MLSTSLNWCFFASGLVTGTPSSCGWRDTTLTCCPSWSLSKANWAAACWRRDTGTCCSTSCLHRSPPSHTSSPSLPKTKTRSGSKTTPSLRPLWTRYTHLTHTFHLSVTCLLSVSCLHCLSISCLSVCVLTASVSCFRCLWTLQRTRVMTITPKTTQWDGETSPSMFPHWAREERRRGRGLWGRASCDHVICLSLELQPGLDLQRRRRPSSPAVMSYWSKYCGQSHLLPHASQCKWFPAAVSCCSSPRLSVKETWLTVFLHCDQLQLCLSQSSQAADSSTANIDLKKNVWFRFYPSCQFYLYV